MRPVAIAKRASSPEIEVVENLGPVTRLTALNLSHNAIDCVQNLSCLVNLCELDVSSNRM
jgi:Leucine-rich repeat (LRR) protein